MNSAWKQLEKAKTTLAAIEREPSSSKNDDARKRRLKKAAERVRRKFERTINR